MTKLQKAKRLAALYLKYARMWDRRGDRLSLEKAILMDNLQGILPQVTDSKLRRRLERLLRAVDHWQTHKPLPPSKLLKFRWPSKLSYVSGVGIVEK